MTGTPTRLLTAVLMAAAVTGTVVAGTVLAATVLAGPAMAAEEDGLAGGGGFLNPFPPGDVYPLLVVGDTFAEGLVDGLVQALGSEQRLQINKKFRELTSLMRTDFDEALKALDEGLAKEQPQIAVVMLGASDRIAWKMPNNKRAVVGSDEWKGEFSRRVDRLMRVFKARSVALYWVGLPVLRRSDANDDAEMMNDIIRERAVFNGLRYVDSFKALADEGGGYSDMGPDITGKMRRLRESDGVNFTDAGNRKLAHFVEKELKRDLTQAKQDRNIPLAGSEPEQAKINAARKAAEAERVVANVTMGAAAAVQAMTATAPPPPGITDQKADNGRITLRTATAAGKEETVTLDIVRPALPASVIAAVTRKESPDKPSQMGDSLLDQIAGGVTVMSSVTPSNEAPGARRKLSPTQSPYFRVLVKGEKVDPRPGRADELAWPRPEPPAFAAEPPKSAKPVAAVPPPPAPEEPKDAGDKPARKKRG